MQVYPFQNGAVDGQFVVDVVGVLVVLFTTAVVLVTVVVLVNAPFHTHWNLFKS